jgi:hypothetical protein
MSTNVPGSKPAAQPPTPTPTPAPAPVTAAPTLSDVGEDVTALETEFKGDFAKLSADTKSLITKALTAAKAEGSTVFAALHATVTK